MGPRNKRRSTGALSADGECKRSKLLSARGKLTASRKSSVIARHEPRSARQAKHNPPIANQKTRKRLRRTLTVRQANYGKVRAARQQQQLQQGQVEHAIAIGSCTRTLTKRDYSRSLPTARPRRQRRKEGANAQKGGSQLLDSFVIISDDNEGDGEEGNSKVSI